jgi:Flp pilus assembly pilin Flp
VSPTAQRTFDVLTGSRAVSAPTERSRKEVNDYMLKFQIKLQDLYSSLRDREEGQTLTEYALILSLVSVASIGALGLLSGGINGVLNTVTTAL